MQLQLNDRSVQIIYNCWKKQELFEYSLFIFGSRADGTARNGSDVDIGIQHPYKDVQLGYKRLMDLSHEIHESDLPFEYDLVDFNSADPEFTSYVTNRHYIVKKLTKRDNVIRAFRTLMEAIEQDDSSSFMRDSIIQRFEYTLEVSWKYMRHLLISKGIKKTGGPFDIFRLSVTHEIIRDAEVWVEFVRGRNKTSHMYDEDVAKEIYDIAIKMPKEVTELLEHNKED